MERTAWILLAVAGAKTAWWVAQRWLRTPEVDELVAFNETAFRCHRAEPCGQKYCCDHNLERIVARLDGARVSLDLCVYILSSAALSAAVKRAHQRGVAVRIIADDDMVFNNGSQIAHMYECGVRIRTKNSTKLMHHKFCLIDSPSRIAEIATTDRSLTLSRRFKYRLSDGNVGLLISGSMNWTQQALNGNWEHVLITSHAPLVTQFQSEFDALWKDFVDLRPY